MKPDQGDDVGTCGEKGHMEGSRVERKAWPVYTPQGDKRNSGNLPEKISVALAAEEMGQQLMKYDLKGKLKFGY